MPFDVTKTIEELKDFIRTFTERNNYKGAVVGVSGGIDSAVVLTLCSKALGSDKVLGLILPERDSSRESVQLAKMLCRQLNVEYKIISMSSVLRKIGVYRLFPPSFIFPRRVQENYVKSKWVSLSKDPYIDDLLDVGNEVFRKGLAYYRIKHRMRMCLLYFEAEKRGYAVVGCVNKTELKTGLYVKWGDSAADIEPIAHLYKTQVIEMAKQMNILNEIIERPPTPDLIPGLTDEFILGLNYRDLDRILMKMENNLDLSDEDPKLVKRVREIYFAAHRRNMCNVRISERTGEHP
ncbi:NAD(+) synthase [Pseudothermotoga sp.]|uniref:NAD(+) synthase n=1 Tax=Pseudothermotoga sp. TaxID=2033661 RepID=UPI0031F68C39